MSQNYYSILIVTHYSILQTKNKLIIFVVIQISYHQIIKHKNQIEIVLFYYFNGCDKHSVQDK